MLLPHSSGKTISVREIGLVVRVKREVPITNKISLIDINTASIKSVLGLKVF